MSQYFKLSREIFSVLIPICAMVYNITNIITPYSLLYINLGCYRQSQLRICEEVKIIIS